MTDDIRNACRILNEGGIIVYPTDTIWGLGCDATNAEAVQKIYDIKRRADRKAMLVLTDSSAKIEAYVSDVPAIAWDLIEVSDKPLTIIYEHGRNLATNLTAEDGSIGIRVTQEAFSQQLCRQFRRPIVSTSANISGQPSPACFADISEEILRAADYVVSYRRDDATRPKPSSIIKLGRGGTIQIIRN
ncbi:MAG: threonylcarbamoyl-AMP synthase [Prevotellaceae bacterium]|nr:threonylcarbamoyl-AMP synthase [Prevotellaceae bacterium]